MWTMKLKMCQINEARFFFLISRGARTPTNLIHSTVRIRLDICTLLSWPYYQTACRAGLRGGGGPNTEREA